MSATAFGLAMGVVNAALMAALAWAAALFGIGKGAVDETAKYYPGYRSSLGGGLIGALYGLATGFVFGWTTVGLYNSLLRVRQIGAAERAEEVVEAWEESEL